MSRKFVWYWNFCKIFMKKIWPTFPKIIHSFSKELVISRKTFKWVQRVHGRDPFRTQFNMYDGIFLILFSANPAKWSITPKKFVCYCRQIVWVGLTNLWGCHLRGYVFCRICLTGSLIYFCSSSIKRHI